MGLFWAIIVLFLLLYPAALLGGIVRGKIGSRAEPFRNLIHVATYAVLALIIVPIVT